MTERRLYTILFVLVVFGNVLYRLWPKLKANNIFMERPSNKNSDYLQVGPMAEPRKKNQSYISGIVITVLLSLFFLGKVIYHALIIAPDKRDFRIISYSSSTFALCFFLFLAVFVHLLINNIESEHFPNLKYTFRVWFSTILVSPLVSIPILCLEKVYDWHDINLIVSLLGTMIFFANGLGMLIFCVLLFDVRHLSNIEGPMFKKKQSILIRVECVLMAFLLAMSLILNIKLTITWIFIFIPYNFVLAWAVMFYTFNEPERVENNTEINIE